MRLSLLLKGFVHYNITYCIHTYSFDIDHCMLSQGVQERGGGAGVQEEHLPTGQKVCMQKPFSIFLVFIALCISVCHLFESP